VTDTYKHRVYRAEAELRGRTRRFATIVDAQVYVDRVWSDPRVEALATYDVSGKPHITVIQQGRNTAYSKDGTITLPRGWAMNQLVVLHEVAHELMEPRGFPHHGREYCQVLLALVAIELGDDFAAELAALMMHHTCQLVRPDYHEAKLRAAANWHRKNDRRVRVTLSDGSHVSGYVDRVDRDVIHFREGRLHASTAATVGIQAVVVGDIEYVEVAARNYYARW
jgi:putative metallohydrolase (TIGR04338 family)